MKINIIFHDRDKDYDVYYKEISKIKELHNKYNESKNY